MAISDNLFILRNLNKLFNELSLNFYNVDTSLQNNSISLAISSLEKAERTLDDLGKEIIIKSKLNK